VTVVPFPLTSAVIYTRFILSHLSDRINTLKKWLTQVRPGGILVLDETEEVVATRPVFQTYLEVKQSLVRREGGLLFSGLYRMLSGIDIDTGDAAGDQARDFIGDGAH
jgi:hypothetical protein